MLTDGIEIDDAESRYRSVLRMVGDDEAFETLCRKLFVFSPFEALGVADYEVRHGNFLAYLFNLTAAHGFGEQVLVTFLKQLFSRDADATKLAQVVINGVGQTLIRREWHDIDIVIELHDPKLKAVIAVELKVHAQESAHQLEKYTAFIEGRPEYQNYEKLYVFMTPEGTEASQEGWRDFNMTAGFVQSLKQIAANNHGNEMARAMLADYVRIMEQKFMTEKELEDLAEALWGRYPDALGFLADNRPDVVSKVFDRLQELNSDQLYARLKALGFDLYGSGDWDHETNSRLIYSFPNWDAYPGMVTGTDNRLASKRLMWLQLAKTSSGIRAMFIIGPGDGDARKKLLQALIDGGADTGSQKSVQKMSSEWSTLGSAWLLDNRKGEHSLEDLDSLYERAVGAFERFLVGQLPKLDSAIKTMR